MTYVGRPHAIVAPNSVVRSKAIKNILETSIQEVDAMAKLSISIVSSEKLSNSSIIRNCVHREFSIILCCGNFYVVFPLAKDA